MDKIKLFTNNGGLKDFEGFTLQRGFIYGFMNDKKPLVCNGTIFSSHVKVYFQSESTGLWKLHKIPKTDILYNKIVSLATKNKEKEIVKVYASGVEIEALQIEEMRKNGYEPRLFRTNDSPKKKDGKCKCKRILDIPAERNYLQMH